MALLSERDNCLYRDSELSLDGLKKLIKLSLFAI